MENERYVLNQVSVRLKLQEEAPLYSTTQIDTPQRAIEVMKDMMKMDVLPIRFLDCPILTENFIVFSVETLIPKKRTWQDGKSSMPKFLI